MTYQSKAALREEIYHLQSVLKNVSAEVKSLEMDIQLARTTAAAAATREALELVINALELRGYGDYPFSRLLASAPGVDRFEKDLRTALSVRAERAQAEEDAATEARIAGLAKKDSGGTFSFSFIPTFGEYDATAPTLADLTPRKSKLIWEDILTDLAHGVRAEKPQSETAETAETAEKATKKPKGDKK